jgi:lactate racemase
MRVDLAFGKSGTQVDLPPGFDYTVLQARSARPLPDAEAALRQALDHPIASPPLRQLADGKASAAISVCDITRPAPNSTTLPHVLQRLHDAGLKREKITILIATGLHRPATEAEIEEIVGKRIASAYRVVNHRARELGDHGYLGETPTGTPVFIDERFLAADLHITLGFIEPHLMLGYSGGRKLIAPGLAAAETIKVLHSSRFMREARAVEGSIAGNPLHQELLQIARMARHDFMMDVALTRERKIAGVFAGHPESSHAEGVRLVSQVLLEQLEHPVDAVITTGAGYPLDLTFYQSIKGITAASHIVKPGGSILLVAECQEGSGAPEFSQMLQRFPTPDALLEGIQGCPVEVDQWQLEKLALVAQRTKLSFCVPGLPAEYRGSLWGPCYDSAAEAVDALTASLPAQARIAVIPEGPYVLAKPPEVPPELCGKPA